jgi:hypothetical protein
VHGAGAEDQVVPGDASRVGGHALDDSADAAEHPLASTTLLMTVRLFVPGTAANTMVPRRVLVPLVAAAAVMAGAAEIASAVPAASYGLPPRRVLMAVL